MMNRLIIALLLVVLSGASEAQAQDLDRNVRQRLEQFFNEYKSTNVDLGKTKLERIEVDHSNRNLLIFADSRFGYQPFREENVQAIYRHIKQILPGPVANYRTTIMVGNKSIEDLIPNYYRSKDIDPTRLYEPISKGTTPWVSPLSKPYKITKGLEGRHLSLWQSHGKYYINKLDRWGWQRPNLFCTNEDLFTQSFVVPYLIPMLENAGAVVFTPRERDTQVNEVIVDNDVKTSSIYNEENHKKHRWTRYQGAGFGSSQSYYHLDENPFLRGTSRIITTQKSKAKAFAQWVPNIPQKGQYAVYVSYQSTPNSVSDAKYIVFHQGGISEFSVNQKIGGGTWVYLGHFEFAKGNSPLGMVILTNESKEGGVVSADAVRFGGGIGSIVRGNTTSGVPRYLEGAKYSAQWYGLPSEVYNGKQGSNDYTDDINTRSNAINYLSGGSVFNPNQNGLGVPLELNLALHSDAGYKINDKIVGTLGIYTTVDNNKALGTNRERISSRDFADIVLTNLEKDIQANFDISWTRRSLWDKNYSETRLPEIPSIIIELLSHQNFGDMQIAHDPNFKFVVSRSIYKSILAYLGDQRRKDYVVQPLPIRAFSAQLKDKNRVSLNWSPMPDPTEPSATPQEYVVYTKVGNTGFDNGTLVRSTHHTVDIKPGLIYSFKVTAVNRGGESFPSETLVAYKAPKEKYEVLIVNGFQRISGPKTINTDFEAGFDLYADPGVSYLYNISLVGSQQNFRRTGANKSGSQNLGHSSNELEGYKYAGNSFDYPYAHGKAMQAVKGISFSSASREAVELEKVNLNHYPMVDFIMGLQKVENYNPHSNQYYKTFTPKLQSLINAYTQGGGAVMVSGSHIGSDMNKDEGDKEFIQSTLNYDYAYAIEDKSYDQITGLNRTVRIPRQLNEHIFTVSQPEVLTPVGQAFPIMTYDGLNHPAAIASEGAYKTFVMGFPFETISNSKDRANIMASALYFLLNLE